MGNPKTFAFAVFCIGLVAGLYVGRSQQLPPVPGVASKQAIMDANKSVDAANAALTSARKVDSPPPSPPLPVPHK